MVSYLQWGRPKWARPPLRGTGTSWGFFCCTARKVKCPSCGGGTGLLPSILLSVTLAAVQVLFKPLEISITTTGAWMESVEKQTTGLRALKIRENGALAQRWACSALFSLTRYLCAGKIPYALQPDSQTFTRRGLWDSSNVRLTDDAPFSSFQGWPSRASAFYRLVPPADGWCSGFGFVPAGSVRIKVPNTSDLSRRKPLVTCFFPRQAVC